MAIQIPAPRKQRTRQHVIADLSVHHLEGFVLEAGHTCQRMGSDYGYGLILWTFDEQGYVEPGAVCVQLKAMETLEESGTEYVFDLDIRDYNLWIREEVPVLLVLFDAGRKKAYWLHVQGYFKARPDRQPKGKARSIRVRIPKRQVVNHRAVDQMRELKWATLGQEQAEEL